MAILKEMTVLRGKYGWIIYANPDKTFCISSLTLSAGHTERTGKQVKYVGSFPEFERGTPLVVRGYWEDNAKYGPQFQAISVEPDPEASMDGLRSYLSSGLIPGIGKALAEVLVEAFGKEVLNVLEDEPDRLLEVQGIGEVRKRQIVDGWHDQRERRDTITSLQVCGFTLGKAVRVYDSVGTRSLEVLKANPYDLLPMVQGLGFASVDQYALLQGFEVEDPRRLYAGIIQALDYGVLQGHAFYTFSELCSVAHKLLTENLNRTGHSVEDLSVRDVFRIVDDLSDGEHFVRDVFPDDRTKVYLPRFLEAERNIPNQLRDLMESPYPQCPVEEYEEALTEVEGGKGLTLSGSQREAVFKALTNKVYVLTGGPGTGKTTICQFILDILDRQGLRLELVSPTGRAAKRLSEVTGYTAQTIHRLLGYSSEEKGFLHNSYNPLSLDVLLVDEASMVDLVLFQSLLDALPNHARLIIVGDSDQLPSVRPGVVLRDLLKTPDIASHCLTEIFRQGKGSLIIDNAHKINAGQRPALYPLSKDSIQQGYDFFYWGAEDFNGAAERVVAFIQMQKDRGNNLDDLQVLMPKKRGENGTEALNPLLRDIMNPAEEGKAEVSFVTRLFRLGDRVIQTVNNYDLNVFNGDVGVISEIDPVNQLLTITYPDQEVVFPYKSCKDLELAYALTIHKSQGSEYKSVLLVLLPEYKRMLYRNLFYTGVTRAKKRLILVGSLEAIDRAVSVPEDRERNTLLAYRLKETFKGFAPPEVATVNL